MFSAKVYRVMVGSLSGTMEEVYVAKETIRKWNLENAERTGKLFLPIEWSVKFEPNSVDVVMGIVGNWIETYLHTEEFVKANEKMVFFFNSFYDPKNTIPGERNSVNEFKRRVKTLGTCIEYNCLDEFNRLLNCSLNTL